MTDEPSRSAPDWSSIVSSRRQFLGGVGAGVAGAGTLMANVAHASERGVAGRTADPLELPAGALIVDDFDGNRWPGENSLGNKSQAAFFENGAGEVVDDGVRFEYDGSGVYSSDVCRSVADYPYLALAIRGEAGDEAEELSLSIDGECARLSAISDDPIGTDWSLVTTHASRLASNVDDVGTVGLYPEPEASGAVEIAWIGFVA